MTAIAPGTKAAFAEEYDVPLPYMQRTRDYYLALGYDNPYRWASFTEVPFVPLGKPLAHSRVGLITTAAPYRPEAGEQGPGAPYNAAAKFYQVYSVTTDEVPDCRPTADTWIPSTSSSARGPTGVFRSRTRSKRFPGVAQNSRPSQWTSIV